MKKTINKAKKATYKIDICNDTSGIFHKLLILIHQREDTMKITVKENMDHSLF